MQTRLKAVIIKSAKQNPLASVKANGLQKLFFFQTMNILQEGQVSQSQDLSKESPKIAQHLQQSQKIESENFCRSHTFKSNQKNNSQKQPESSAPIVLIRLSKRNQKYAVNYECIRIGIIKPGIDCSYAEAQLQYGAFNNTFKTPSAALNYLVDNYLRIRNSGIKFEVSDNHNHYIIERNEFLIKIDVNPEDCVATINWANDLKFEYFPDPRSAISYSFDLILNPPQTQTDNDICWQEF